MPAKDSCQRKIVAALERDGWTIAVKPPGLRRKDYYVLVDVEAVLDGRTIYVEVKCFPGNNASQELYLAFGQYIVYRSMMKQDAPRIDI